MAHILVVSLALSLAASASAAHFAVLVAGSSGYSNYRHHADVCHAQRILVRNGEAPRARALARPLAARESRDNAVRPLAAPARCARSLRPLAAPARCARSLRPLAAPAR
jgi:hypothetical protein